MGIPAFYRWLVNKYPKAVAPVFILDDDATSPNPNGFEFDNLYLDKNGIIHPCFHPDDDLTDSQPTTFEEVFISVFEYVDRLFNIVRPRKLIYFAIDGVAPRAKMNQQRAGRYQTARNNEIAEAEEDRLRRQYEREGKKLLPKPESQLEDSSIISPGTEFMCEFSKALQVYIHTRLQGSPAWKNLKVILSDANVPGEGEHKVMSFIRSQRSLPDYDANTRHCLHGLDADLIMLALATHELHFSILREDVLTVKEKQPICIPTNIQDSDGAGVSGSCKPFPVRKTCSFQFVHIRILREYLELDMQASVVPEGFKFDTERAVDDFVFLTFFVGNDFLPHFPSLGVHEGALDLLMTVYKRDFKSIGGYLVDAQRVNDPNKASYLKLERVERLILSVGSYEDKIFKKRTEVREHKMRRILTASRDEEAKIVGGDVEVPMDHVLPASPHSDSCGVENNNILENTKQLKEDMKKYIQDHRFKSGLFSVDKIRYGTTGWKERYYQEKFATKDHEGLESIKKAVAKEYIEGLCWVLLYYFSGVPSWTWFYPFHYGPCASDLKGLGQLQVKFEEGFPLEPFDQLMAVLPPRCVDALPRAYRNLMTDESSEIASFFPRDFKVDLDGKVFLWQGHVILPFIDEKLLLSSTRRLKEELEEYEADGNLTKSDLLYVRASSDFGCQLMSKIGENPRDASGVGGFVNMNLRALGSSEGEDKIVLLVPRILENVKFPDERTVHVWNIKETVLWHEQQGGFRGHRVVNQTRSLPPPENERLSSSPSPNSPNSRQGLYNHPNWSNSIRNPSSSTRPMRAPLGSSTQMGNPSSSVPRPTGFRPRGRNSSYPSRVNSEANALPSPQFTSQLESSRVSAPELLRGSASQVGRGRGQFWPYMDGQDFGAPENGRYKRW